MSSELRACPGCETTGSRLTQIDGGLCLKCGMKRASSVPPVDPRPDGGRTVTTSSDGTSVNHGERTEIHCVPVEGNGACALRQVADLLDTDDNLVLIGMWAMCGTGIGTDYLQVVITSPHAEVDPT